MTCQSCGNEQATGNFCAECGGPLQAVKCPDCGTTPPVGSRFCTECGRRLAAGGASTSAPGTASAPRPASVAGPRVQRGRAGVLPWAIAGVLLVGIVLIVGLPRLGSQPAVPPVAATQGSGVSTVDLSTMTPREAADRLFNRVVGAAENGDSIEARNFVPMAIAAYERVPGLDHDGYYHLSVLQRIAGQFDAAIQTAELVLAAEPAHILALSAAGEAALQAGDAARARGYFERLVAGFDQERGRQLSEYLDHSRILETIRADAESYLQGNG